MTSPRPHDKARGWQFGPYRLDLTDGQLLKHGKKLRLQDQPLRVLVLLLERKGEVVTREEIRQLLWGNDTFVDFDHALNATMTRLRQALGDSAASPRYIETLARKGYRFAGSAASIEAGCEDLQAAVAEQIATQATTLGPVRPDRTLTRRRKIGTAAALASGAAFVLSWVYGGVYRSGAVDVKWRPLTAYPGFETRPALSPDGKTVAFSWIQNDSNSADIYVKSVDFESASPVTATPEAAEYDAAWSPDGRRLGFLRRRRNHIQIVVLDVSSRIERPVADVRACGFRSLSWSPDGEYLLVTEQHGGACLLSAYSVGSGRHFRILEGSAHLRQQYSPAFSPDGRTLAFVGCTTASLCRVYRVELVAGATTAGTPEAITGTAQPVQAVAWLATGKHIVYAVNVGATAALYLQQAVPRVAAHMLAPLRQDCVHMSASKQRSIIALSNFCGATDVLEIPLSKQTPGRVVAGSTVSDTGGTYSPDGRRIAFTSTRSGTMEIWTAAPDGAAAMSATSLRSTTSSPAWSPDGRWIVFDALAGANADIYVVGADGTGLRQITSESSSETLPSWSRDGRYIYFTSDRSGVLQIWRMDVHGGMPLQITRSGATRGIESHDGQFLYFTKELRHTPLWRMTLPEGQEEKVADCVSDVGSFAAAGAGIYFIRDTSPRRIALLAKPDARIVELAKTPEFTASGLSIAPDENRALVSVIQRGEGDLTLVEIDSNK